MLLNTLWVKLHNTEINKLVFFNLSKFLEAYHYIAAANK